MANKPLPKNYIPDAGQRIMFILEDGMTGDQWQHAMNNPEHLSPALNSKVFYNGAEYQVVHVSAQPRRKPGN
jgi:hypothetical protein